MDVPLQQQQISYITYVEHLKRRHEDRGCIYAFLFALCCCFCCFETCECCLDCVCCCCD